MAPVLLSDPTAVVRTAPDGQLRDRDILDCTTSTSFVPSRSRSTRWLAHERLHGCLEPLASVRGRGPRHGVQAQLARMTYSAIEGSRTGHGQTTAPPGLSVHCAVTQHQPCGVISAEVCAVMGVPRGYGSLRRRLRPSILTAATARGGELRVCRGHGRNAKCARPRRVQAPVFILSRQWCV